jgi:glyoxylase-like metal-dependent hydrolase (beta-lactamase superfamily II)
VIYTREIDGMRVTNLIEYCGPTHEPAAAFPGCDAEIVERHKSWLDNDHYYANIDRFVIAIQIWIVQVDDRVIVVDTGVGNAKVRPSVPRMHMLNSLVPAWLAAVGADFDQVTDVVQTHMHGDHVGWNCVPDEKGGWKPAFPNAKYHFPETDLDYFRENFSTHPDYGFEDSIKPILDAGNVEMVHPGDLVAGVLHAEAAPGHTPGQVIYWLGGPDGPAVFSADIMHHPIQIVEPQINTAFCSDPEVARETRRAFLNRVADCGALIMPCHFGAPHCGYARRDGAGFRFEPAAPAVPGRL